MSEKGQLYFGGDIYTVDEVCPETEAVAVRDGKIVAVGSESDCRSALGDDYEPVDLGGKALLPGFIDTHLHPTGIATYEMFGDLRGVATKDELIERIREFDRKDTSAKWVVALQFEDNKFKEPRLPTRHVLDVACPDRPTIIVTYDGHTVIANTRAIEATEITASTENPEGGTIEREPDGYPAGPFRETAVQYPLGAMPMPEMEKITEAVKVTFKKIASHGIASAGIILQTDEEGVFGKQGQYDILLMTALLDIIPINLYSILVAHDLEPIEAARKTGLHVQEIGAGHTISGLKFWADGTFGSCTAYMSRPFSDQPDKRGSLLHSEEEMYRRMVWAHKAGLQIAVHVIGDAACRTIVGLFEQLLKEYPRADHRHRLEHASLLDSDLVADIARLGLVVSTSAIFIHAEKDWLYKRLGEERAKWTYPLRALVGAGIKVAGQSDAPIASLDVLHAIQCAVTREGFESQQGITTAEAIRMYTIDAAYAQFEESVKGSINVGKRADFIVLSDNPVRVPTEQIRDIRVERTIVGGKVIYKA